MISSCNSLSSDNKYKTTFYYNSDNGITSLDPAFAKTQDNIWAVSQLFNGLVQTDKLLNIKPCIAKKWEISADGLIFRFTLRQDVYFHSNSIFKSRKVVAQDFVYTFSRIMDEKVASPGAWIFNDKVSDNPFIAINDSIFELRLKKPFPPMLSILCMPYCMVVPKEACEKLGKAFGRSPVGTGPFMYHDWLDDVKLILHKNGNYFENENGKKMPYLDAVAISFSDDKQGAFLDFIQGKLDLFNGMESSFKDELVDKNGNLKPKYFGNFTLLKSPFLNTEYIAFQIDDTLKTNQNNPLRYINLRKAIYHGIDRQMIVQFLRNNIGNAAHNGFVPKGLWGADTFEFDSIYNPKLAKRYLNQFFKSNPNKMPKVVLSTNKDYFDICLLIQKQLMNIGLEIEIQNHPSSFLKEEKANNRLSFFRGSWIADYPDGENYLACFYSKNFSPNGPNYTHFKNSKFDELYELQLNESNLQIRKQIWKQMEQILYNQAPIVPLYYDQSIRLIQNRIKNLDNTPINGLDLRRVIKTN